MATTTAYDPKPTVIWELTRACDLACPNCSIVDHETRSPLELWTHETLATIDEIASVRPRRFVISGGDPLQRNDLDRIIDYALRRGLDPILALSPTAMADDQAIRHLGRVGVKRVTVPLDDPAPDSHGVSGSFRNSLRLITTALAVGLEVEVNTLVTRRNFDHLHSMHERLIELPISAWNLYLLVPVHGPKPEEQLTAIGVDRLHRGVQILRARHPLPIRMFESPDERRYERQASACPASETAEEVIFIRHNGEVWPGEFLPIVAGNIRNRPLRSIHRKGQIFEALRDGANLKGKCGLCEFGSACSGSRARAYATAGDPFASDPLCSYQHGGPALYVQPAMI
jgi:radical SAM protein with 4Fe4S-binding SPASM domain